ncbi:zinc finger protein 236-like isoform X2 [Asterias rubens]|nr:zinc finger protein 236-like isoform X2 [Asterias rubens]XP_033642004.1 zinc finger protein 236-like isoform X2 [Asterias rubens]XP_033642005.1 zinc finger protein 236-like isoform X2 [Asterias rubens]
MVDKDDNVPFGTWKIYPLDENDKVYNLSSADATIPQWLHFIRQTPNKEQSNMTLVQVSKKFYFEMTKDVAEGVEYAVMGRRSDTGVEGTEVVAPPQGKRRGRKPGPLYTPEELLARREQKKKELEERLRRTSTRDRSRRCIECGVSFTSAILFMRHRGTCGLLKEEDLLTDSSEGSENTDDEMERDLEEGEEEEGGDEGGEEEEEGQAKAMEETLEGDEEAAADEVGDDGTADQLARDVNQLIAGIEGDAGEESEANILAVSTADQQQDMPLIPNPLLHEIRNLASVVPVLAKRPRGRPRKDGQPPIQRKKRMRKRRKRRHYSDSDDRQPSKQLKDECIPTLADPEKYPFTCETCGKFFPTKSWFDMHTEQHTQPGLTYLVCNLCDMAFRFLTEHTWHMEETHQLDKRGQVLSEKFRCDSCKKPFRSPIHLERHRRRAAEEEPLPKGPVQIKCKFCEKSFSMELGLENHTEKHHLEYMRYQCTENDCLVTFSSKEDRAAHLEGFHMTDCKQIYKCPVEQCYKAYTTMAALNYHYELRHTGASRPFQCEICGKRWVKIGKLREHLKTHSTEKNELCDICGRAYKSRPELKDHRIEAHTEGGKIKLQCRFCPAQFSRRSSRSYHEKRHKNDFPYVCPKPGCNKRFIAVIDYKRHLIFHTGAKLYRCRFCNNCFTRSDYLKGHEKKHHLRGEKLNPGPSTEETVTIKVPWQMEKGVRIHGQNVVVIIEPDPALADGRLTEEAISALETLHEGEGNQTLMTDSSGQQIITSIAEVPTHTTDILQQAAAEAMQQEDVQEQPMQLLQFAPSNQSTINYVHGNSASAAIQEAVLRAMNAQHQHNGIDTGTTHQILLQTGEGEETTAFLQHALDGETQIMQTTSSEQAALMLQELAANGAQVVFQPSGNSIDNTTTMQATLQGENGETSIVMVNLGPEMVTEVDGATSTITIPMTSEQMTSEVMTSEQMTSEVITPEQMTSEVITPEQMTSDVITSEQMTSEVVTSEQMTSEVGTAEQMSSEAITSNDITPEAMTSEPITTEPLTTEPLTTEPLTTEPLTTEPLTTEAEISESIPPIPSESIITTTTDEIITHITPAAEEMTHDPVHSDPTQTVVLEDVVIEQEEEEVNTEAEMQALAKEWQRENIIVEEVNTDEVL